MSEIEVTPATRCEVEACGKFATERCASCRRALCRDHTIADYAYLPGGQRPYCVECDSDRRQLYQVARRTGLRAVAWSAGGAVIGAAVGYVVGALATSNSFAHTVTTDVGFVLGLAAALSIAANRVRANQG